jgi:hypothetical protein
MKKGFAKSDEMVLKLKLSDYGKEGSLKLGQSKVTRMHGINNLSNELEVTGPLRTVISSEKFKAPISHIKNMPHTPFILPTEDSYRVIENFISDLKLVVTDTPRLNKSMRKGGSLRVDMADTDESDKKQSGGYFKSSSLKNSPKVVKKTPNKYLKYPLPNTPRAIKLLTRAGRSERKLFVKTNDNIGKCLQKAKFMEELGLNREEEVRLLPAISKDMLKLKMEVSEVMFVGI